MLVFPSPEIYCVALPPSGNPLFHLFQTVLNSCLRISDLWFKSKLKWESMEIRRKHQKSSKGGSPRQSQIKLILVVLSINDTLMEKHLFNYCKFTAGKSLQCLIETDFRPIPQSLVGRPPNMVSSLSNRLLIHVGKKKVCTGFVRANKLMNAVSHTYIVCEYAHACSM